jgi:putative pre-16S rRNA nuclease
LRIMAIDYGTVRIGVSVSDELEIAAHPAPTVSVDGCEFERLAEIVRERDVELIVVGLPLRMDGSEGPASRKVRSFVKELKRELRGIPVVLEDERLTTSEAHDALSLLGARPRERRREVDRMAAQLILQRHLERRRSGGGS